MLSEGIEASEILDTWYLSAIRPSFDALTHYLERQRRLDIADVPRLARQFLLLLMAETGFTVLFEADNDNAAEAIVERSLDLVLRSYPTIAA